MRTRFALVVIGLLCMSGAMAQPKVLYWTDHNQGVNAVEAALADLGWDVTVASDEVEYNDLLGAGGWDVTCLLLQNATSYSTDFANLGSYISGGGKALFTDWTQDADLGALFGITYTGNFNQTPITLAGPFGQGTFDLENPGWGVWSMGMSLNGASSAGTFGNGDVAIAYTSNTVINGWLKDTALYPDQGKAVARAELEFLWGHATCDSTPELSTWALLACSGLAGLVFGRRRKA